jgi:hypothetical protein
VLSVRYELECKYCYKHVLVDASPTSYLDYTTYIILLDLYHIVAGSN